MTEIAFLAIAAAFSLIAVALVTFAYMGTMRSLHRITENLDRIAKNSDARWRLDMQVPRRLTNLISAIQGILDAVELRHRQLDEMVEAVERREHENLTLWLELENRFCVAKEEAERDGLTGLLNRRRIEEVLECEVKKAGYNRCALSVLMLDLDRFKHINDTYGHQTGDDALRVLSEVVKNSVRLDDFAGRYGGEEFIIVLPGVPGEAAVKVAERINEHFPQAIAMENSFPVGLECTVSIGVADYPTCGNTKSILVANADAALLEAKRTGRNRVIYYGDLSMRSEGIA